MMVTVLARVSRVSRYVKTFRYLIIIILVDIYLLIRMPTFRSISIRLATTGAKLCVIYLYRMKSVTYKYTHTHTHTSTQHHIVADAVVAVVVVAIIAIITIVSADRGARERAAIRLRAFVECVLSTSSSLS